MSILRYQREIGENVNTFGRNLLIIDREIRPKIVHKHGKPYNLNQKFYKYRCLNCGNEDWIVEYALGEHMHCGCNACCCPPKKVVIGVNDITTTAPWMVKYFPNKEIDAQRFTKYAKNEVDFVCPDCGRIQHKSIMNVCAAKTLSCVCGDRISYPNKYMYALLEQLNVSFEKEKTFSWESSKRYDFYIENNNQKIIVEMNGIQHYKGKTHSRARSLEEEQENDKYKKRIAIENGIDKYFIIDCSLSDSDFIKNNIISSGMLDSINVSTDKINWDKCDMIATSNFTKAVCDYKNANPNLSLSDIAKHFKTTKAVIWRYVKKGAKFGWCTYNVDESRKILDSQNRIDHNQKPIYCLTNDTYYRSASEAEKSLSTANQTFYAKQIRQSILRGHNYLNYKFIYITREKFNQAKMLCPDNTVGNSFHIDRSNENDKRLQSNT